MILVTLEIRAQLCANDQARRAALTKGERAPDPVPVVRFFNPVGDATWLATEIDEDGILCRSWFWQPGIGQLCACRIGVDSSAVWSRHRARHPVRRRISAVGLCRSRTPRWIVGAGREAAQPRGLLFAGRPVIGIMRARRRAWLREAPPNHDDLVGICYNLPFMDREPPMSKNRMIFHDPRAELPPVTIESLKGDLLRFTQVDEDGRTNVVMLSGRHAVQHGVFDSGKPDSSAHIGAAPA